MSRNKLPLQSAKFRKDYMIMVAFVLFFTIVFSEFTLAVWLPWHLRLDSVWSTQVAQQEMVNYFDGIRRNSRYNAEKLEAPRCDEVRLYCRTLDRVAPYLHRYREKLSPEECNEMATTFRALTDHYYAIAKKGAKALSAEKTLDCKAYYKKMRGRKPVAPPPEEEEEN